MSLHRAYKYRLYPTDEQRAWFGQCFAAVRVVYNAALEQRKTYGRKKGTDYFGRHRCFSKATQSKEIHYRAKADSAGLADDPELSWITAAPRDCLEAALRDLDKAFDRFFKDKGGYPSFRNAARNNSLSFKAWDRKNDPKTKQSIARANVVFGHECVTLPKIGRVRYKRHRKFYGDPKTVEVVREGAEYYVILVCDQSDGGGDDNGPDGRPDIGVDLGVTIPVALSNGEIALADEGLGKIEKRVRREQRKLSRCKRASKRRQRQKHRVADLKRLQARRRTARVHRITTELTRRFHTIAIEDLKIANMTASAKGDAETPGKNVRAKAGLNRAILNVAPYKLREQLIYKAERSGGRIIAVDPKHTSQTCAECGHVDAANRAAQADFICTDCGHTDNADINAARNILRRALNTLESRTGDVPIPRKSPSEFHRKSATTKASVSSFEPALSLSNHWQSKGLPDDPLRSMGF